MTILFAGGETEAFVVSSANVIEVTDAGSYDSGYARCSIRLGLGSVSDYAETPVLTTATTSWTHFEWYIGSTISSSSVLATWYNSSGTAVFRVMAATSTSLQMQYWSGSAWTSLGTAATITPSTRHTLDVKIICGGSGSAELFINGSTAASGSASMTAVTNIAKVRFGNSVSSGSVLTAAQSHISQIIVADSTTVGFKFFLKPPTANGANTAFTGTYADVDEMALSQVDYIESVTAGDVETYTGAALTVGSGTVKAVVVSGQVKNGASGPQNVQFVLRRGGTDYASSNAAGIGAGYAPLQAIWATDPSTGAAWVGSAAGAAGNEFGVKSVA